MLEVEALEAGYGDTRVLDGIDLWVAAGEVVAVLGPNGAGKTTLNSVLSGLLTPAAGRIVFDGEDVTSQDAAGRVAAGLTLVPEGRRVFPNLSVRENLELGCYRRGGANRARNLETIAGIFPRLAQRWKQRAGTLSGGEQQMLAIGRGMMAEPRMLILDEPSLGLAPIMVDELFRLIERIRGEGLTLLLVEQNVVRSLEVADRAYVLDQGRIALSGLAGELAHSEQVKRAYLGL